MEMKDLCVSSDKTMRQNVEFILEQYKRSLKDAEENKEYELAEFIESLIDDLEFILKVSKDC